jgi:hypothetical protein
LRWGCSAARHVHESRRADDGRAAVGNAARGIAACECGLGCRKKGIAALRQGRRSGVRSLSDESKHETLDAERAGDGAGGRAERREHGALLDVQLEIRARVDGLESPVRLRQPLETDTVIAQRIDQRNAASIARQACRLDVNLARGR